jgi:hypothetical protein
VCKLHGAAAPQVQRRALVRAELARWGLGDTAVSPADTLLRLVSQSSRRVEFLSGLLAEQYALADAGMEITTLPGRLAVLVGQSYALSRDGDPVPVGEAIRALVELEQRERSLCASFACKAVMAGLETRDVELAERTGGMIAEVLRAVLADPQLGLSEVQRAAFPSAIRSALQLLSGAG